MAPALGLSPAGASTTSIATNIVTVRASRLRLELANTADRTVQFLPR